MYFKIAPDCASVFPSGVTINGIWPSGGFPAKKQKQKKVKNDCYMSMISGKISGQSLSDDVNVLNEVIKKKKSMLAPHFMSLARHANIFLFFFFNRATKFA